MSDTSLLHRTPLKLRNNKRAKFQIVSPNVQSEKYCKGSSFSTLTMTNSSTLAKAGIESQKFSDEILKRPKRILKFKSISPIKLYKRLQTQGEIKKSKVVIFKDDLVETKSVPSVNRIIFKQTNHESLSQDNLVLTKCTCACHVF